MLAERLNRVFWSGIKKCAPNPIERLWCVKMRERIVGASIIASYLPPLAKIDDEHEQLLELVERLNRQSLAHLDLSRFLEEFSKLGLLITKHFDTEDAVIKSCGMPIDDVAAHLKAHTEIIERYTQVNMLLMADRKHNLSDVAKMVKEWVIDHQLKYDDQIIQYARPRSQ